MKKLILLLICSIVLNAQTVLTKGDIGIVRMNEDSPSDGFSFVVLVPVSAGTIIYFAEEGWYGNPAWNGNTESHIKYTAPAGGLAAGTVVHVDENVDGTTFTVSGGGGTIAYAWGLTGFNLSGGDQILAYQTNEASKPAVPTFITGLTLNDGNTASETNSPITHWTDPDATGYTGVSVCRLPLGLTNGENCISVFPDWNVLTEKDNARYGCSLTSGTRYQLKLAINNNANWIYDDATNYPTSSVCSFNVNTSTITFVNGSTFTQSISPNSINQVLGRFRLTSNISGSNLKSVTIKLNGVRSGLSNLKLWVSTDAVFGGDSQIGSTIAADPGDGNSVTFSDMTSGISTTGNYYFLTGDVAAVSSGSVIGVITAGSSFTTEDGTISTPISNAPLSDGATPLPVELISFAASIKDNKVELVWNTAHEINCYGYEIERAVITEKNNLITGWNKMGFIEGAGNSNNEHKYIYVDNNPPNGEVQYRLRQVDNNGSYEYSSIVALNLGNVLPNEFSMEQNYPNPFNPATRIEFTIPVNNTGGENGIPVQLKLYNTLGVEVAVLVNDNKKPGRYEVTFNGSSLASGVYFYKLSAGSFELTKKMILAK